MTSDHHQGNRDDHRLDDDGTGVISEYQKRKGMYEESIIDDVPNVSNQSWLKIVGIILMSHKHDDQEDEEKEDHQDDDEVRDGGN